MIFIDVESLFYELLKYFIVFAGLFLAYFELKLYTKYIKDVKKILLAIIGIYWSGYYIFSILRPILGIDFYAHQLLVRPGILFTLAVITARAWDKYRRLNNG
jgi:hypothetical protein